MAKRGRPKLLKGEGKRSAIAVRFQFGERELLIAAANASNLPLSEWIRKTLAQAASPPVVKTITTWQYREAGDTIFMQTSDPLTRIVWQRLKAYVELLKPDDA